MQEETFGPTLPIATFTTEEEAIRLANDSEFGLTASVWTAITLKANESPRQIEAGSVCVNEVLYTHGIGQTPWGGFKNSGRGRTHGREGLMELVQPQHIHTNHLALCPTPGGCHIRQTPSRHFAKWHEHLPAARSSKRQCCCRNLLKRIR